MDSHGRPLQLALPEGAVSIVFNGNADNRKMPENSGNDLRYNKFSVYHNAMLIKALPTS